MSEENVSKSDSIEVDDKCEIPQETAEEIKPVDEDPYAYLSRDFSSENFKIEIKNMPKYYGICVSSFQQCL